MKTIKHLLITASVVLLGSFTTAEAQIPGGLLNDADITFLQQASQRNAFEIIGGQMPRSHSTQASVRRFGTRVTRDNNLDSARIRALALRLGVSVSIKPSAEQITDLKGFGELFNGNFDREWLNKEIKTILDDIRASLEVIQDGSNLAVRNFARRRLPTLLSELQLGVLTAQRNGLELN